MNDPSKEHFLAACGSAEPLRIGLALRDDVQFEAQAFQQPYLVIGRRPGCDLVLDHWQVSRRHAYLQLIEGRYYCVDLGSRTGTHGGDATERSGWLEQERAIQIGPYTVQPEWPDRDDLSFGPPHPGVTWELPNRALNQAVWRMDRDLVLIGRSPACMIRIVEPDVSMFHCSVVLTSMGVWVVDLLGQKGVFVNDEPTRCVRLEDGDTLRVGRHILRARYDAPPRPLPRPHAPAPASTYKTLATVAPPGPSRAAGELAARIMPPTARDGQELATFVERSGAIVDPSINLLVHQFGLMQQQMFDQFHQTMMMMFEGFAALHREQVGAVREEFEQVRKLSQEIEALRVETARLAESARLAEAAKLAEASATKLVERPRPSTNGHPPLAGRPAPALARNQATGEPIKRAAPPPPDPNVDIHAQLCLRLSTIQTERQNRWQKILGMMSSR